MKTFAWLVILCDLLTSFAARAQTNSDTSPRLELRRNGPQLELAVPAEVDPGVLLLLQAPDLNQLLSAPVLTLLTNAPVTNVLRLPLSPQQSTFFYAIRKAGRALEDFIVAETPDELSSPYSLWTLGVLTNMVSGVTFTADFLLVVSTNQLADVTGAADLSVVRAADGLPHPDAQITPAQIMFEQGGCRTNVQVTAATSLAGYVVAVTLLNTSLAPQSSARTPISAASSSSLTLVPVIRLPDSPPSAADAFTMALAGVRAYVDTAGWSSPIATALPEVSGTFGEWRGTIRDGQPNANYHAGLDLMASAGATVSAARGGIVRISNGSANGRFVNLDHLDGWYSRYLHLSPSGTLLPNGSYVQRGDPVGVVATSAENGGLPVHTHFELRSGPPGSTDAQPGIGLDPLRQTGLFAVRAPLTLSTLDSVGITPNNPAAQLYTPMQPVAGSSDTVFVVLQIKQPENGRRLSPQTVRFKAESMSQFVDLSTPDTAACQNLLPAASALTARGFARYNFGTLEQANIDDWFRYWFRWSVSGFAADARGPRTFTVESANYAGTPRTYNLKWGPEILTVVKVGAPVSGEQRYRMQIRAWVGEDASTLANDESTGAWDTGADWYRYELPVGGRWVANNSANYDETASSTALMKLRTQEFLWNPAVGGANAQVTVRSRAVPAIAHQKPISAETAPSGMALIPSGSFQMGDTFGEGNSVELPVHSVFVSAFYMDKYEVTKALWDEVYSWALGHGYTFEKEGSATAINHPVHFIYWYDMVKWCNARSEKEGLTPCYYTSAAQTTVYQTGRTDLLNSFVKWTANGYRLPTETEWEKGARGGLNARRFPWGDTISHSQANYPSQSSIAYDISPTRGSHHNYPNGSTSPAGSFAPNGYGIYDMAGNVWEWCWDWYGDTYGQPTATEDNSRGPAAATGYRALRGGGAGFGSAYVSRCAARGTFTMVPGSTTTGVGFRCVRGL